MWHLNVLFVCEVRNMLGYKLHFTLIRHVGTCYTNKLKLAAKAVNLFMPFKQGLHLSLNRVHT